MIFASAHIPPSTGLRGLREHWRNDVIAGFSVALVALPLALGIAIAAGAPPISGVMSSIVAGLLTTFLRGSYVAINGPGNSLIVLIAMAYAGFGGGAQAFPHVLGAVVVSGAIQVVLGLLRLGKLGDLVPSAVIQGLLSAIGLIIVGTQLHVVFGRHASSRNPIEVFQELPHSIAAMNPFVALIGVVSVLVMALHPTIKKKLVHFVPAPLWVVLIAVPMVLFFNFLRPHTLRFLGDAYHVGPDLLVSIPDDLIESLVQPTFSRIGEPVFWRIVVAMTLVTSIENIVSVKAVDTLDSYGRRSNLDRDLVGMGLSTMAAGALGALPVLTVVARSSVNVNHGAKTSWSNFFHGVVMLVFVVFLSPLIQEIPLAALAGILVYTGYRLTAPHIVKDTLHKGPDHFLIFAITVGSTLVWGLLWGILIGLAAELVSHLLILGIPARDAFGWIRRTRVTAEQNRGEPALLRVDGVASFLTIPKLRPALQSAAKSDHVIVDFSRALLVDSTLLEYCHDFGRRYERDHDERQFEVIGLEAHDAISSHPDALHVLRPLHARRLTPRQRRIQELAEARDWGFEMRRDWEPWYLKGFHFFRVHPLEYRDMVVDGRYQIDGQQVDWKLCDVTFDEGAVLPEVYHTTAQVLWLPVALPEFMIEQEELLDRVLQLAGFQDIDFKHFTHFSRRFVLKGPDEASIRKLMTPELVRFLESREVYHLESDGDRLVVFRSMRLASPREIERMLEFSERLVRMLATSGRNGRASS